MEKKVLCKVELVKEVLPLSHSLTTPTNAVEKDIKLTFVNGKVMPHSTRLKMGNIYSHNRDLNTIARINVGNVSFCKPTLGFFQFDFQFYDFFF